MYHHDRLLVDIGNEVEKAIGDVKYMANYRVDMHTPEDPPPTTINST